MKNLFILLLTLLSSSHLWAQSAISTQQQKMGKIRPDFFQNPIDLVIKNHFHTNIDGLADPINKNIYSQEISLGTRYKHRPFKRSVLINLPRAEFEYTGSLEDKVRKINVENTLIGLYFGSGGRIYSTSASINYNDSISANEEFVIGTNQYFNLSTDFTFSQTFKEYQTFSIGPKFQIREFIAPTDVTTGEEDDFMKYGLNTKYEIEGKGKFKAKTGIKVNLDRKVYREKRGLLKNGFLGANSPETTYALHPRYFFNKRLKQGSFGLSVGYKWNRDELEGGRSYRGMTANLNGSLAAKYVNLKTRLSRSEKNYDSQLVDNTLGNTAGPLYEFNVNTVTFGVESNTLLIKRFKTLLEYSFFNTDANRASDSVTSHQISLGIGLKI